LSTTDCSKNDIKSWLQLYPWLVVFDGLDEVPSSSNRIQLLKQIEDFRIDAAALNADIQIVSTTRPQNYSDEFNTELYSHWYLTPLMPSQALIYAERLVSTRCGQDKNRKNILLRKLKKACETQATARLMQSPLQVTIMTTLVERIGEPPRQRYALFSQYFRTIYEREIGREGPLSALLSNRQTDIKTIHYRAGLLLQTQSETAGGTESQLTDKSFENLVKARLSEVGLSESENSKLLGQITDGSLQRLVFLVRPKAQHIAFEIRSLQEFMAAEALMSGKEASVLLRLKTIAPISHWRNVFLFAVGKIFASQEYLCENICFICLELNDRSYNKTAEETAWGARLALDIITEGIAKPNPKYERQLVKIALELVEFPEYSTIMELANIHHENLEDLFEKRIKSCLELSKTTAHMGAWMLLIALIGKKIPWAVKSFEEQWPEDKEKQAKILMFEKDYTSRQWMLDQLVNIIPFCTPIEVSNIKWPIIAEDYDLPTWFKSARNILNVNDIYQHEQLNITVLNESNTNKAPIFRLISVSKPDNFSPAITKIKDMPFENHAWAPFFSAARLTDKPTKNTLAEELRWLSNEWKLKEMRHLHYEIIWPLSACLSVPDNQQDLLKIAQKVDDGQLGSFQDWELAENRWKKNGIHEIDMLAMTENVWPFDDNIKNKGFAFESCSINSMFHQASNFCRKLLEQFNKDYDHEMNIWLAYNTIELFKHPNDFKGDNKIRLTAADFKRLISASIKKWHSFNMSILGCIDIPTQMDEEWVNLFNWLGSQEKLNFSISKFNFEQSTTLANWYVSQPNKFPHVLKILGLLSFAGNKIILSNEFLNPQKYEKDDLLLQLSILLLFFSQREWEPNNLENLKQWINLDSEKFVEDIPLILDMFRNLGFSPEKVTPFSLTVLENFSSLIANKPDIYKKIINSLTVTMNSRKSEIHTNTVWHELDLPETSLMDS